MPYNRGHASQSHKTALCGVLCALSVALLLAGNILQIGTYAAPMLASLLAVPVAEEYGPGTALMLYLATALLGLLVVPDKELALFYALVLGYYPVLKKQLDRLRPALLRWAAKLLYFNAAAVAMYALLLALFASPALLEEFAGLGTVLLGALLGLGNAAFILFDIALGMVARLYHLRLRKKLQRFL